MQSERRWIQRGGQCTAGSPSAPNRLQPQVHVVPRGVARAVGRNAGLCDVRRGPRRQEARADVRSEGT